MQVARLVLVGFLFLLLAGCVYPGYWGHDHHDHGDYHHDDDHHDDGGHRHD